MFYPFRKISKKLRDNDNKLRPNLSGGRGGHGGKGGNVGGAGGLGEGAYITVEEVYRFCHIYGGTGGNGGDGNNRGGIGGIGQGQKFGTKLVSVRGTVLDVPTLTVTDFCEEYCLSDRIRNLLDDQGFETVGSLLEVSDVSLLQDGFKKGQIAEMKRALRQFLFKYDLL
ncbi:hypothetical protein DFH09DRAFT_1178029, partial [Mycena vulgaris]